MDINSAIKMINEILDKVTASIADFKKEQEQIKIAIYSLLGTVVGLYSYGYKLFENNFGRGGGKGGNIGNGGVGDGGNNGNGKPK